jgi:CBS domain-containing protein
MDGFKELLDTMTSASPLFPNDAGAIARVTEQTRLGKALQIMLQNKLTALPVTEKDTGAPLYFLTMLDIIAYAMHEITDEDLSHAMAQRFAGWLADADTATAVEHATVGDAVDAMSATRAKHDVLVKGETKLSKTASMMLRAHSNHALVVDEKRHPFSVISMSRLLTFAATFVDRFQFKSSTIASLGLGNPYCITCHESDRAADAFRRMVAHYVASVAVVNDKGEIVGNLSSSDFKLMHYEDKYWSLLGKSVKEYLAELHKAMPADTPSVLLSFTGGSTFAEVLVAMVKYHVHHIYIVDDKRHPIGVVSNRDMIREILVHKD